MARPSDYPYWATLSENDPVLGTPNKVAPSAEKQDYGQRANKNTLRQDVNYLLNNSREWIQYFDEQSMVGDVYITADLAETNVTVSARLGGTWNYIDGGTGADTIAGQSVIVFKRTA